MSSPTAFPTDKISIAGTGLAIVGASHFVAPQAFAPITSPLFPDNTRAWTLPNGGAETAIGMALTNRRTRPIGWFGLAAYLGFLGFRALQAQR